MPMFVLFNLANRVTSVLPACNMKHPGRADPNIVLSQLVTERANRMVASPALLERLADFCLIERQLIPDMRCISTGGGPVGPTLPQRLRAVAPSAIVRTVYGSTEAEPIASIDEQQVSVVDRIRTHEGAGLLVGKPVRGCAVRIIESEPACALGPFTDEAFSNRFRSTGSVGEIVVSGDHVINGYANPLRDRETKIRVENTVWHRTGDAGSWLADGSLCLHGTMAQSFDWEGRTWYPFVFELQLDALAGIRKSTVICSKNGPVVCLETQGSVKKRRLESDVRKLALPFDWILRLGCIPRDPRHNSKIDHNLLRRLVEETP